MKEILLSIFSSKTFKVALGWILFLGSLAMLICGYSLELNKNGFLYLFLTNVGQVIFISVLFSFLSTSAEFYGMFRKMLEEVLYTPGYIKKRVDIEDIWERTSEALFNSKFPTISHSFLDAIKRYYIPINEINFYNDYRVIIEIDWLDDERKWLKLIYNVDFELHAVNEKQFDFESRSWTNITDQEKLNTEEGTSFFTTKTEIKEYFVDEKPVEPVKVSEEVREEDKVETFKIALSGKKSYKIKQVIEKTMCIEVDNYCSFNCKWLVNNMNVQVFYPENMNVNFVSKGTAEDFKFVNKRSGFLQYEYKGLILRSQGYLIILTK